MSGLVLVALSGGPDSTALLLMLRERGEDVVAAHYDHALQPAAADMSAAVKRLCDRLGVRLITERRSEALPKGSVEAAARTLRYRFLERAAATCGARRVALAHTADDVVEGAVLHAIRGSGLAGMRGMPESRGLYVRPLLDTWRVDIDAYLAGREVTPIQDPANSDVRYARVRVRREVIPALERDRPGIVRRLHAAARRASALQAEVVDAASAAVTGTRAEKAALGALPQPVAAEAVRLMYRRAGGADPGLGRAHIDAAMRLVRALGRGGRGVDLPGGLRFRAVGSRVEVVPGVPPLMEAVLESRPCAGCDQPGAVHLKTGLSLSLASRRPGLRMHQPRGTRKLQDVFVDGRIPREDRDAWPLVMSGDELAWVPGVAVDDRLLARPGEAAQHVTVARMLAGSQKTAMLKSANSPRGESS